MIPKCGRVLKHGWNVKLPSTKGLDNHEMIDAIHEGKLKAMYLFGEEISLVDSNSNFVNDGLSKLEFFVAQDIFFSNTCQFADVVLPASPSLEKEGTFHQHRAAHTKALSGASSRWREAGPTGESSRTWRTISARTGITNILRRFIAKSLH